MLSQIRTKSLRQSLIQFSYDFPLSDLSYLKYLSSFDQPRPKRGKAISSNSFISNEPSTILDELKESINSNEKLRGPRNLEALFS